MAGVSRETQMSIDASSIFPGFKFSPTDAELISYYLRKKIDGFEKCVEVISEVEIYKFEPWDLPAQSVIKSDNEWFFFCARGRKYPHGSQSRRATESGYWKATGKERNVKSGADVIGTKRTLVFHRGRAPKGERTEWIMHEYCMKGESQEALVVCRLRRNTEFRASTSQRQSSTLQDSNQNILEGGIGPERTMESFSPSESELKLSNDAAESSTRQQDSTDEDCYADILNDDIIKLDETSLLAPAPRATTEIKDEVTFDKLAEADLIKLDETPLLASAPTATTETKDEVKFDKPAEAAVSSVLNQTVKLRPQEDAYAEVVDSQECRKSETMFNQRAETAIFRSLNETVKPRTQQEARDRDQANASKDMKGLSSFFVGLFVGLFWVKMVDRKRLNMVIVGLVLLVLFIFLSGVSPPVEFASAILSGKSP